MRAPIVLLAAALAACTSSSPSPSPSNSVRPFASRSAAPVLTLSSSAFADGAPIPREYTCDGRDVSPPLSWSGAPAATVEMALIMDDPDARALFTHWTIWRIPPAERTLPVARNHVHPEGRNSAGRTAYGGPCPPRTDGPHHYRFTLYALGRAPVLARGASPDDARRRITEAAIASVTLTGTYDR